MIGALKGLTHDVSLHGPAGSARCSWRAGLRKTELTSRHGFDDGNEQVVGDFPCTCSRERWEKA